MYTIVSNTCLALFQILKIKAWQKVNKITIKYQKYIKYTIEFIYFISKKLT